MVSCYELRLGNRVLVDKNVQRVSMITASSVFTIDPQESQTHKAFQQNLEQIQPVPLTDDVLKQCGFVYHQYFKFWRLESSSLMSEMDVNDDYDVIDFMRRPIIKKVASLHQLQNIYFMLKGRELKIV